jgi:hypothetical protein
MLLLLVSEEVETFNWPEAFLILSIYDVLLLLWEESVMESIYKLNKSIKHVNIIERRAC